MAFLLILLYIAFGVFIMYWIVQVPIRIARSRGISGDELNTITILSWAGVLFAGFTWVIAIVLSLMWQPSKWIDKNKSSENSSVGINELEKLQKLADLKERNIITEAEFYSEKQKILSRGK